jgi:DNA-binding MarR family transcriptional regulator
MSRNGEADQAPAGGWLEGDQQRAWLAYIRVQLRLAYEMNRQLLADSSMSLADYDVLTALSVAGEERMPITVLAAQIGWERSRVSHHVRRMSVRGLVTYGLSAADRRVTEVALTGRGRQAQEDAAAGHVDLVQRLFLRLRDISRLSLANYVTYHVCWREEPVTGPPAPACGTTEIGSLDVTKRNRDLAEAGTGAVADQVVPAQLACRIGARARAGERAAWPTTLKLPFAATTK